MKTKIRIAFFIGSLRRGGAENQLVHLLAGLDKTAFEPYLILFHGDGAERANGLVSHIEVLGHTAESFRYPGGRIARAGRTLWSLQKCLRRIRPDILHCFLPTACVLGVAAGRWTGIRTIICSRRALAESYRTPGLLTWIDQSAMRRAHVVLANSAAVSDELCYLDGIAPQRVRLIYNGVDVDAFRVAMPNGLRGSVGATAESVVVGTVANFFAYKGHADLVEAARRVVDDYPAVRFVMVGRNEAALLRVREQIERLHLHAHVHIQGEASKVMPLFKSIDIYACPSQTEGFSNVLLEAMAAGKPVVATQVGGNPEAVVDGQTGILVPPRDPEQLAKALRTLVCDVNLRRRMGAAGLERVADKFSLHAMVRHHEQLYSSLVAR